MSNQVTTQLSKLQLRIIKLIAGSGGLDVPQNVLNKRLDTSKMAISKALNKLKNMGLLESDKRGRNNFISLTKSCYPVIFSKSPHETKGGHGLQEVYGSSTMNSPNKGDGGGGLFRVHGVNVTIEYRNQYGLREKKERWIKRECHNYKYDENSKTWIGYLDGNQVRMYADKVEFYVSDKIGYNISELKRDIFSEVESLRSWFEKTSEITLKEKPESFEVTVNKQHVALVGEPFGRFIDEETNFDLSSFKVYSKDGSLRYYEWDKSKGIVEMESKNHAFSEDLIKRSKNFWRVFAEEGFDVEDLKNISEHRKVLEKLVDDYKEIIDLFNELNGRVDKFESFFDGKKEDKVGYRGEIGDKEEGVVVEYDEERVEEFRKRFFGL